MLEIAGGILLAVVILWALPLIFVGILSVIGAIFVGVNGFNQWCRNTMKLLLSPIAKGFIKLCEFFKVPEENWGMVLAIIVLVIFFVAYMVLLV